MTAGRNSFLPAEARGCGRELATNITQKQLGEAAVHCSHSPGNKLRFQQLQTAFSTTLKKHVTSNELDAFEKKSKKRRKKKPRKKTFTESTDLIDFWRRKRMHLQVETDCYPVKTGIMPLLCRLGNETRGCKAARGQSDLGTQHRKEIWKGQCI